MRYHYTKSKANAPVYGKIFRCNHPVYDRCTLYLIGSKGLGVIQQRFDPRTKQTSWTEIDDELVDQLYLAKGFDIFFDRFAGIRRNGYYPTVTVRQIMWALRLKPLEKYSWETVFDRKPI